jgi:hypothetical protein
LKLNLDNEDANLLEVNMNFKNKLFISLIVLLTAISLSACGGETPAEPTTDPAVIMTNAVATSYHDMTMEAIMNPTETPIPTETPLPTNTPEPTLTFTPVVVATLPGAATSSAQTVATQPATNTGGIVTDVGDKAEWVSQIPADYTKMYLRHTEVKSPVFDIFWTVKNTGTTTWNDQYKLRYYSRDEFFRGEKEFSFPSGISVEPGETAELKIVASRPNTVGTYDSVWVLTNPDGINFCVLTITIEVVDGFPPDEEDYPY